MIVAVHTIDLREGGREGGGEGGRGEEGREGGREKTHSHIAITWDSTTGMQYGNEAELEWGGWLYTLKFEEDRCTSFSKSSFKSATVLRLSICTWMSGQGGRDGGKREKKGCRGDVEEQDEGWKGE